MEIAVWKDKIQVSWSVYRLPIHGSDGSVRLRKLRISRDLQKDRIRVVRIKAVGCQVRSINCGKKASLLQRISEALIIPYSEIGGMC